MDAIAVTSAARSALAPTLPGMEGIGVKGINIEAWNAVMVPATMPMAQLARPRAAPQCRAM
jgi:tripartite-type tricarboxylate transporter receptor subunit TctC